MSEDRENQDAIPEQEDASCYQWPMYSWVSPLLARGSARLKAREFLAEDDLLRLPDFENPQWNADVFTPFWEQELKDYPEAPKLARALRKAFARRVIIGGMFRFLSDFSAFASPFLLRELIRWLNDPDAPKWEGFVWSAGLTLSNLVMSACLNAGSHNTMTGFQQMSTALMVKIYDAALEHPAAFGDTGTLTNAHSVDTAKFIEMSMFVHGIWVGPILVIAAIVALYFFIGWAGLVAVALMILLVPMQSIFMSFIATNMRARLGFAKVTVGAVNEALQGIRICKFMNWEGSFAKRIQLARAKEVAALRETYFYRTLTQVLTNSTPLLILFSLFLVAAKLGEPITADNVFPTLAMINVIRVPLMFIPMSIAKIFELQFSIDRIQGVLLGGKTKPSKTGPEHMHSAENAIEVKNVTVYTNDNTALMSFEDVVIPKGKLTVIVGCTGSGKSTLVNTMLGEVKVAPSADGKDKGKDNGKASSAEPIELNEKASVVDSKEKKEPFIATTGGVAFVPQEAWLMNASIEKNIILHEEHELDRYVKCLEACQLLADIDQLAGGDDTQVGERGITLSGGQKQRISLARAAYSHRDIVIMDDPLSAVDPQVRRGLFFDCIGEWMAGKTRVLVTHQTQFLPHSDKIIHISKDHEVVFQGNYAEYVKAGFANEESKDQSSAHTPSDASPREDVAAPPAYMKKAGKTLDSVEENAMGTVDWGVYGWYCSRGGWSWVIGIVFGLTFWRTSTVIADLWLTWWSGEVEPLGFHYQEDDYILWFGVTILVSIVFLFIRMELFRSFIVRVATNTHQNLLLSLLRAPVSFYDTTPMGRILNRCSKDIDVIDAKIPEVVLMVSMMLFLILGMVVVVSFTTPYFLVAVPFIAAAYRFIYQYYAHTVRGLKRLEGSSRSPFMSIMNETIGGLTTIRAFNCTDDFSKEHIRRSQVAIRPVYCTRSCQRWIAARTEFMGSGILFLTSMLACMSHVVGETSWNTSNSAGLVALAITYAMLTTNTITWLTRMMADLESDMSSTERVKEYSLDIPQEKTVEYGRDGVVAPPTGWPAAGGITFEGVQLRYRDDLPLVLKGIDLAVKGGEKVGVVGRTGSGKSTIMLALFRMVELAEGRINIDGHDISNLSMDDLRKNITIIPQDPTLFQGTVRSNLDPFDTHDDDHLFAILNQVNLWTRVGKDVAEPLGNTEPADTSDHEVEHKAYIAKALGTVVTEKGANFSVGERQLMCLARALLKKSRILLLDEATASVDFDADTLIQHTIRTEFAECTVLTIAHRLATVIDSDKLLVLDDGLLVEFDTPKNLLANSESIFTSMAAQLGSTQFEELKAKADEKSKATVE